MDENQDNLKIHLKVKFLYSGIILKGDVYTEKGEKVIEGGKPISTDLIRDLISRGVQSIYYTRRPFIGKTAGVNRMPLEKIIENSVSLVQEVENTIKSGSPLPVEQIQHTVNDISDNISVERGAVLNLMDLKDYDDYTYTHSVNVCLISVLFAKKLNLNQDLIAKIGTAGLLHDQGKLMVPQDILNKESKLTSEEFEIIKRHPIYGYEIVQSTGAFSEVIQKAILFHHEKYNGKGYPMGLKGEDMGEVAQIISLADVFDAITTARSYKEAMPFWYALTQINKSVYNSFSPRLARMFIRDMPAYLTNEAIFYKGMKVKLNTGEYAEVKDYTSPQSFFPVVSIFRNANGEDLHHPIEVNLEFDSSRFIDTMAGDKSSK